MVEVSCGETRYRMAVATMIILCTPVDDWNPMCVCIIVESCKMYLQTVHMFVCHILEEIIHSRVSSSRLKKAHAVHGGSL